ncbi:hypothetical protein [Actinomadura miaoliensis]|uniref:hypothetical protein n=1 Tax=Actinomadura miaoliensis TaxID=430685 RepID=UPI0031EB2DB3
MTEAPVSEAVAEVVAVMEEVAVVEEVTVVVEEVVVVEPVVVPEPVVRVGDLHAGVLMSRRDGSGESHRRGSESHDRRRNACDGNALDSRRHLLSPPVRCAMHSGCMRCIYGGPNIREISQSGVKSGQRSFP